MLCEEEEKLKYQVKIAWSKGRETMIYLYWKYCQQYWV